MLKKGYSIIALGVVSVLLVGMFLNDVILAKKEPKPRSEIITVTGAPTWTELDRGVYVDLLLVSNVEISEGTQVLALFSASFKCKVEAISPIKLRYRANDIYGEDRLQGFAGYWADGAATETVEIHHAWNNLPAGDYTFAIQYWIYPTREMYVASPRLTLVILR